MDESVGPPSLARGEAVRRSDHPHPPRHMPNAVECAVARDSGVQGGLARPNRRTCSGVV